MEKLCPLVSMPFIYLFVYLLHVTVAAIKLAAVDIQEMIPDFV